VADQYTREGFDARAVAVYKQIINLDPDRTSSYEPLADLYERMGLAAEALSALQTAADSHHRQGRKREALALLRKMATMDPSNTTSRLKVAELLRQEGLIAEAVAEYAQVGEELDRQGDAEATGKIYRRLLELDPNHVEALVHLGRELVRAGKAADGEALARRVVDLAPDEPAHYELLADVYRALGREDALAEAYRSLAELFRRRGDDDEARAILQRHVPPSAFAVEGEEIETLDGNELGDHAFLGEDELGGGDALLGDELIPGEDAPAVVLDSALATDEPIVLDEPVESAGSGRIAAPAIEDPAQLSTPEPDCDPDQLLAEASVYLRYGKRDNAIAHLERILAVEPEHRLALEKLGEAHADGGDESRAVEVWVRAVKLAQEDGDADAVGVLRSRIRALDEDAAEALEPRAPDPGDAGPAPAPEPHGVLHADPDAEFAIDVELDDEIEIDLDDAELDDEPPPAAPLPRDTGIESGSLSTATTQQLREDLEEADFYVQQGLLAEAEEIYKRVLAIAPNHPRALVRLGEMVAARGGDPGEVAAAAEEQPRGPAAPDELDTEDLDVSDLDLDAAAESLRDPETEPAMPEPMPDGAEPAFEASAPAPAGPEPTLEGAAPVLDGPAPALDASASEPDDLPPIESADAAAGGVDLVREIGEFDELDETAVDAADDAGAPDADGEGFDLAAELSGEFDDDWASASQSGASSGDDGFAAVFDAFKKGVSEALSEGDHDAHYDLGIAYKEMGLLDDAIGEFRAAMASAPRRLECLHLVGVCALEGGQPRVAVDHLEELVSAPGATESQILAGRFDLGCAWEALGDRDRARGAFESVARIDASFRDVGARLAALRDDSPGPAGAPSHEDFESFEDMLLEDDDPGEDAAAARTESRAEPRAADGESFEPDLSDRSVGRDAVPEGDPTAGRSPASAPGSTPDAGARHEPAPESAVAPETDPPERASRRRKKKISFV
jgi:tetratricopeptide (TPR) repeat protein